MKQEGKERRDRKQKRESVRIPEIKKNCLNQMYTSY